ncbi:type IX secretion system membrane protein PorP/SprF [Marinoscillum sp.]|uniref:PorP/SprF family type IX secretion system membrane protein n=1 Tax=Marinoscillum sp. TaxID=2024838 RepID=UPI003BAB0C1A
MKKFLWVILLCFSQFATFSQLLPKVYNQFFMNPYIYNPAYAGVEGHTVLFVMHKEQWGGIDGAPSLSHVNFHVPLKGGLAFGAMVYNERAGLYTQSAGKVTGGYLVSIDREHFIRFGLSLGAGNNTLNFGEFDSPTDPAFQGLLTNETFMVGDFGMAYHFGHFNVGVSLPSIFGYDLFTTESATPMHVRPHDNVLFKINYRGHLSDNIAIEPHLIYRYHSYLSNQYEATVILHLLHIVWVGASYRQDAGFVGLLGAKFWEKMGVGYSYEYGNPNTAALLGATHEIHIGYHLGSKKDHAEHVSSFIKSHRSSAEERAREAELERQKQLQALQKSRQPVQTSKNEDELGLLAGAPKKEEPVKATNNWNYEKENEPVERINKFGEKERGIKFDRVNEQGEKEVVFSWLPPPPPGAREETYEIANPTEEPLIRTRPDGKREAGIKWTRTIDGDKKETLVIWDEILSESAAEAIDHNPAEAHAMKDAKISIKAEAPIKEEPPIVEEPKSEVVDDQPIQEEPIVEPTPEEKVEIAKGDPELTTDFRPLDDYSKSDEHQVAKRGDHLLELPAGNYVVAGVFGSFQNAEDQSDLLFERGFHDTRVGFLSARGYYYVVIFNSANLQRVISEKNRVKNLSGLSKVWVLTVNE